MQVNTLTSLHVDNYRSLRDFTATFQPLTILIGRNDAGKSGTLNAIRLLLDDAATGIVTAYDWNKSAPRKHYPRSFTITGMLSGPPPVTIRRRIISHKNTTATSVLEILDGTTWRLPTSQEAQAIPSIYYLRPRTGALQEAFNRTRENNIFTLIRDWMPAALSSEGDLDRLMRSYRRGNTLRAFVDFFQQEVYPALRLAFPTDFPVTQLHPEYRSPTEQGLLLVRELTHSGAKKAVVRLPIAHHGSGLISSSAIIIAGAVL